jgi:hypothetical protein
MGKTDAEKKSETKKAAVPTWRQVIDLLKKKNKKNEESLEYK